MNATLKEIDEKEHEDSLTESYGTINICGLEYNAGWALRQIDPTAFDYSMAGEPDIWLCEKCDTEFDNEEEAEECCKE